MDLLAFHTELIKLRKDEILRLNALVVYIMIGLGAGLLSQPEVALGAFEKAGLVFAFIGFGVYFVYRVMSCLLSIHYSMLVLRRKNLLVHEDVRGLQLSGGHLFVYGIATLVMAGIMALLVNALVLLL